MALRESRIGAGTGLVAGAVRVALIAVFTVVETATLVVWLALVENAPALSRAAAIGFAVLVVGLIVEHVLTDFAVNGIDLSFPVLNGVLFSVSEAVLWVLWLAIADAVAGLTGVLVAGVVLAVLLVPQHSIEDNVLRGRGLFANLLTLGTVGFSIVEAAGATVWLLLVRRGDLAEPLLVDAGLGSVEPALVGVGVLAVALLVEHSIGVRFSRRGRPGG